MKKILLTGSSGFVGKAFCDKYKNDFEITRYDLPNFDILDYNKLLLSLDGCDYIVHAAAIADLYDTEKDLDRNFDVNVRGTYNVAKAAALKNVKMIYISTCCVYGNSLDSTEYERYTVPATIEPYACSKLAGENLIRGFKNLKWEVLRIGTVYGPGMRESLFNYIALDAVKNNKTIKINGNGNQSRNYVYIDDLIEGIYLSIINFQNYSVFNICGDQSKSVIDTIKTAELIYGKTAKTEMHENRYGEIMHENISNSDAANKLKWFPKYLYGNGMEETVRRDIRLKK